MSFSSTSSTAVLLAALLLVASAGSSSAAPSRKLLGTAAAGETAPHVLSFAPKPLTGVELAIDQALGATAAPTDEPTAAPIEPAVTRVVATPVVAPVVSSDVGGEAARALPWACGAADAECSTHGTITALGGTASFEVTVAAGETNDMIIAVNSTDGHADLKVEPPADASVDALLAGPWISAHSVGPEAVVIPRAGLAFGRYTVELTARQANTSFTLQVMRDVVHREVDIAQQTAVQQILQQCCPAGGCAKLNAWQEAANTTSLCLYPGNFCSNRALVFFDLSGQNLKCELATDLLATFYGLRRLNLSHNALTIDFPTMSLATQQLGSLVSLDVSTNNVTGAVGCANAGPALAHLDASHNGLTGPVPVCLVGAPALQSLLLAGNMLSGSIPAAPPASRLRALNLTGNQLSGSVPSLAAAKQLATIDLSANKLSGSLPALPASTETVEFSGNGFTGAIPASYGSLDGLESLNLARNALSGALPAGLAVLSALRAVDLSRNGITGGLAEFAAAIPARGGAVASLLLDHNKLSGGVPKTLGRLAALDTAAGTLGLSYNVLSGAFPDWLLSNSTEGAVELQGNRFSCPAEPVTLPAVPPATATDGLLCYTGGAAPVPATANLGTYTARNVTDFLRVEKPVEPKGKKSRKGLLITIPILIIALLAAAAIGGWFLYDRRRRSREASLPYDPETNMWRRGPTGSMYHSPPQPSGGGIGGLKSKARGTSPLAAGSAIGGKAFNLQAFSTYESSDAAPGDRIAAVPASAAWLGLPGAGGAAEEPKTPGAGRIGALRAALGFGGAATPSPRQGASYQPSRPAAAVSVRAGGPVVPSQPSSTGARSADLHSAQLPAGATSSWGPLGAGIAGALGWASGSSPAAATGVSAALTRTPTAPSQRHGAGSHANWHRIALQTAAEERRGRAADVAQHAQQHDDDEPRTPAFGGAFSHSRRRSPV